MKLVMTLLARDEADIIDANIAFHLEAGVDFFVITDNASQDGTTEILERHVRGGHVHLIRDEGSGYRQPELVTRMARLAATGYSADWVINSDADEFWWPRGANLKEVLEEIPAEYGVVSACVRHFVPRTTRGVHFAEALTVRFAPPALFFDPARTYRPVAHVLHRGDSSVTVGGGNHAVFGERSLPLLRGWYPIEVLHFPWRAPDQIARKARIQAESAKKMRRPPPGFSSVMSFEEAQAWFDQLALDDAEVEQGIAAGSLATDTRLRDALRAIAGVDVLPEVPNFSRHRDEPSTLRFPTPTLMEDVAYAVDTAVLSEAEGVRAQKRLDSLEKRVAALEGRLGPRLSRHALRLARRVARRAPRP